MNPAKRILGVLKLTPQSQYGIARLVSVGDGLEFWSWLHRVNMVYLIMVRCLIRPRFEVDSTESIWYTRKANTYYVRIVLKLTPQSQYGIGNAVQWQCLSVLKLTPQSQYGIIVQHVNGVKSVFWSWLHRVNMVYRSRSTTGSLTCFEVDSTESIWYTQ